MKRLLIVTGMAGGLALAMLLGVAGFWSGSIALAQAPTPSTNAAAGYACHNNTAVLQLLGLSQQELLSQRQTGKSLLDIAKAKGVDEAKLIDALLQPISAMHTWMGQTFNNSSSANQMTQAMRDWITKDIRESKLGTMTDMRLGLSGGMAGNGMMGGMMGNGMMGNGMMGNGMMGNGMMGNGMMGGRSDAPNGNGGMMGRWR